jgi:hypothetical protein
MEQITGLCFQILPPFLAIGGILGLLKLVPVGPVELPRKHPKNQRLAIGVLITGVGLYLLSVPSTLLSTSGIVLCVIGTVYYIIVLRSVREEFPRMRYKDSLRSALSQYSFLDPPDDKSKKKKKEKKK